MSSEYMLKEFRYQQDKAHYDHFRNKRWWRDWLNVWHHIAREFFEGDKYVGRFPFGKCKP